jgi:hypothetical protein
MDGDGRLAPAHRFAPALCYTAADFELLFDRLKSVRREADQNLWRIPTLKRFASLTLM